MLPLGIDYIRRVVRLPATTYEFVTCQLLVVVVSH